MKPFFFFSFQPTPETLREDGVALGNYIVQELGVQSLVIHGESIGGVAASRTAQQLSLSPTTRDKISLLICDRTFCNLEAVAQRLVGTFQLYFFGRSLCGHESHNRNLFAP